MNFNQRCERYIEREGSGDLWGRGTQSAAESQIFLLLCLPSVFWFNNNNIVNSTLLESGYFVLLWIFLNFVLKFIDLFISLKGVGYFYDLLLNFVGGVQASLTSKLFHYWGDVMWVFYLMRHKLQDFSALEHKLLLVPWAEAIISVVFLNGSFPGLG